MVNAIIFDLDDTLFDTTSQLTEQAREAAMKAMIKAGLNKTLDELKEIKENIVEKYGNHVPVIRAICEELNIENSDILDAGLEAYYSIELKELELFSDVYDTIKELKKRGMKLAIVTTGKEDFQNKKIDVLRIRQFFDAILINPVEEGKDKKSSLLKAAEQMGVDPKNILSVGDRVDAEIKWSNELGMKTVWFLHGKYSSRQPKEDAENPTYTITKISELLKIVN